MTHAEINALPAGREMDSLVARAIGWTFLGAEDCWKDATGTQCRLSDSRFSTYYEAACEAWEHFKESGWSVRWNGTWKNWIVKSALSQTIAKADTLPLAICRAVLHHQLDREETK